MTSKSDNKDISIKEKEQALLERDRELPLIAMLPNNLMIELTNACNLKCLMCYNENMKRRAGFMKRELFIKIIKEAKRLKIENVGLYTIGESFLHPEVFEFIKIARAEGIEYVYITTNGQVLNQRKIEQVVESGLDSIKFSIDATSEKKYEQLKRGASWSKLIETIKYTKAIRDQRNSKLKIFASFLITPENINEIESYRSQFDNLADETLFGLIANQGGLPKAEVSSLKIDKLLKQMELTENAGVQNSA